MKVPRSVSGKVARNAFGRLGFVVVRQTGGHLIMRRVAPFAQVSVPMHDEIAIGTLLQMVSRAGLSRDEFVAAL